MRTAAIGLCLFTLVVPSDAGIRAPGKYAGIVIFDRWDGCTLYSGIYLMYVSEKVKETLRPYAGKAVLLDATDVYQPINPGDGLIKSFAYLGPAPAGRNWVRTDGLALSASGNVDKDGKITVTMGIANTSERPIKVLSSELAITVLTKSPPSQSLGDSDGPSHAVITRRGLGVSDLGPRWEGREVVNGVEFSWSLGKENGLPEEFTIAPGKERQIKVLLEFPEGEYEFLCGYAGGVHESQCLASNLVAFDVDKQRKAKLVPPKRPAQATSATSASAPTTVRAGASSN